MTYSEREREFTFAKNASLHSAELTENGVQYSSYFTKICHFCQFR